MGFAIFVVVVLAVVWFATKSIKFVPKGHEGILMKGKQFVQTTVPGVVFVSPIGGYRLVTLPKDDRPTVMECAATTEDGYHVVGEVHVGFRVFDRVLAASRVHDLDKSLEQQVRVAFRDISRPRSYGTLASDTQRFGDAIQQTITPTLTAWGVDTRWVEISGLQRTAGRR